MSIQVHLMTVYFVCDFVSDFLPRLWKIDKMSFTSSGISLFDSPFRLVVVLVSDVTGIYDRTSVRLSVSYSFETLFKFRVHNTR